MGRKHKFLKMNPREQEIIIKALDSKQYPHEQDIEVQILIGRIYRSLTDLKKNGLID